MRNAHFFRRHQHQVAHSRRCIDGEIWILVEVSGDVVEISVHAPLTDSHHMQLGIDGEHDHALRESSAWKGIRFVLRHPSGRIGTWQVGDESGQAASWLALSAVPKHRSRRLSPRIGQNLAQTIANGEIFT